MKIKQKTKSSVAKRFVKTSSGQLKRSHANRNHMQIGSTTKQKRHLKKAGYVDKSDVKRFDQCL